MRITASAPGKLILCGEHAVVYRRPALVAAVDLRLTTCVETPAGDPSSDHPVRLRVPAFGLDETVRWREILDYAAAARHRWTEWQEEHAGSSSGYRVRSDDAAHVLKVALGETATDLGEAGGPPLEVTVESALPTGSGFGSSAAAAVTLVAAYRVARGAAAAAGGRPDAVERRRVARLALEVERRQHGAPSGVDGATVLHGGLVWAERSASGELVFEPFHAAGGGGGGSPVLRHLAVFDSGTPPEGTGAVVAEVRTRAAREPVRFEALWDEIEDVTRAFRSLLQEPSLQGSVGSGAAAGALIRRCQRALEAAGVVPEEVCHRIAAVEAAGGAAKISGAGSLAGPGAGSLLVHHPEPEALGDLAALADLRRYAVRLGGPGLTLESGPGEPAA